MKKYFASILMAVLAIVCVTTFTACGGDDDDVLLVLAASDIMSVYTGMFSAAVIHIHAVHRTSGFS